MSAHDAGFKKPMSLGSKARSLIPMTPRNVKRPSSELRNDFAKQVAEHSQVLPNQDGQPPRKRFRSNAAPKGSKLAKGYTDRAQQRAREDEAPEDVGDKQARLKRIEEMYKLQQIDQDTFDHLRDELGIGGDASTTHLVKGLDFKLLERVRRGEDINQTTTEVEEEPAEPAEDVEDELEKALARDVAAIPKEQDDAPHEEESASAAQSVAMTRDEMLRQWKEKRNNPANGPTASASVDPPQPSLDHSKFRKLESAPKKNKHKFTETVNGRRREVLVIANKDGSTKRKTRWLDPEPDLTGKQEEHAAWGGDLDEGVLARQKAAAEAAAKDQAEEDKDDGDIFGGVGDYDPLAGIDSDDEEQADKTVINKKTEQNTADEVSSTSKNAPLKSTSRNYFSTGNEPDVEENTAKNPAHDLSILAALKRAAQIRRQEDDNEGEDRSAAAVDEEDEGARNAHARNKALLRKLQERSGQDDVDVDMSFGGDRDFGDEDESRQKLSQWKGIGQEADDDEEAGKGGGEKAKRKRGGGKKKGDKNSFADVMGVIEGRKKG